MNMKVYGPYTSIDGRLRCIIVNTDGTQYTVSYPRLVMETALGRSLLPNEDVHHKDGDVSNNNISNLEVRLHSEHVREHSTKYTHDIEVECVYCGVMFVLTKKRQSQRSRDAKRGAAGPFCSRSCSGKYGAAIQRAAKQECLD